MIDRERIRRILNGAVWAPSGDNSQPWTFEISGPDLVVHMHPERDHPVFNIANRGTYIAIGALIENIAVLAGNEGLAARHVGADFPAKTVRIRFEDGGKESAAADTVRRRHTNRGPYRATLPPQDAVALSAVPAEPHCRVILVSDPHLVKTISQAASTMEKAALSTRKLHQTFFESIIWSRAENDSGASGLYIRATELPPPIQGLFRVIRHWPVMRALRPLGFPAAAAKSNAAVYARAGAVAAITLDRTEPEDFISVGRLMQRVWLEATRRGLAAQPLAGLMYLAEYLLSADDRDFDPAITKEAIEAGATIRKVVGTGGTVAMLLRVGIPVSPATARSSRRPPVFV